MTLDGLNLNLGGYNFYSPSKLTGASLRVLSSQRARQDGEQINQINLSRKIIEVRGYISANSKDDVIKLARAITQRQGIRDLELIIDGITYLGYLDRVSFPDEPSDITNIDGSFQFIVPNGYGTGLENQNLFTALTNKKGNQTLTADVSSNFRVAPVFTFTAKTNTDDVVIKILNDRAGQMISVEHDFQTGDELVIDCANQTTGYGRNNSLALIRSSGAWTSFFDGQTIQINISSTTFTYDLSAKYTERWT